VAEAQVARADLLPGLSGGVNVGSDSIDPTIKLGGAGLLGLGTGDEVAALAETGEVMARRTADADETARRRLVSLEGQIAILRSREAQGAAVLASTEANLSLFTEQYKVGRRTLLELVGQYDSFARLEREQAAIRYEVALTELEIARDRGLLVDGARM
jgi:adhesin transport system outer membrane protein